MQNRMKTHQLTSEQIEALLKRSQVATLATLNDDGTPYCVPIHFVWLDGAVCFHGLPVGQKVGNLKARPDVCFNTYEMKGLLFDPEERPCDTNTAYESVVIRGKARMLENPEEKLRVLEAVIAKYTPQLVGRPIPKAMLNGTGVVRLEAEEITGKYWE